LPTPSQNLYELIQSGALVAYPDAAMRLAINQAIAIDGPRGWRIAKSRRSRLIRSTSLLH
jgi:hypothetical protein